MTEVTTPVESQEVESTQTEAPAPDLNLSDLATLHSVIEVASSRGAFKAAEMEAVGKVFNKLAAFLESVSKKD